MDRFDIRWYGMLNLTAGCWLLFTHILSIADVPVMSGWSAYVLGSYIATISGVTLQTQDRRFHAANAVLGLATILSPFLFGFSDASGPLLHFLGVGIVVAGSSTWAAMGAGATDSSARPDTA